MYRDHRPLIQWVNELAVIEHWSGISLEWYHKLRWDDPEHYFFIQTLLDAQNKKAIIEQRKQEAKARTAHRRGR